MECRCVVWAAFALYPHELTSVLGLGLPLLSTSSFLGPAPWLFRQIRLGDGTADSGLGFNSDNVLKNLLGNSDVWAVICGSEGSA